jgi:hypothetical protein
VRPRVARPEEAAGVGIVGSDWAGGAYAGVGHRLPLQRLEFRSTERSGLAELEQAPAPVGLSLAREKRRLAAELDLTAEIRPEGKRPLLSILAPPGVWIAHIGAGMLAELGVRERDFRKRDNQKFADISV